jgi:NADPH-dependent 2,4-dienoyl-CoA reductase/sulfur reductase-like enzyme
MTTIPQGLVGMILIDGRVAVTATDFDQSKPGGFDLIKAQRRRLRYTLGRKLIETYDGTIMSRLFDSEEDFDIICNIISGYKPGFEYQEIQIGGDINETHPT